MGQRVAHVAIAWWLPFQRGPHGRQGGIVASRGHTISRANFRPKSGRLHPVAGSRNREGSLVFTKHQERNYLSMAFEARALANQILDLAEELRLPLTHMSLHKIAYFAHGWWSAQHGAPLVAEEFEAWEHGPVLPSVYGAFKTAGRKPITWRAEKFDPVTQIRTKASADFSTDDIAFLKNIVNAYGRLNALTLSDMTHRPGSPWDCVWNAGGGRVTLGMRIKHEAIRAEFLQNVSEGTDSHAKLAS